MATNNGRYFLLLISCYLFIVFGLFFVLFIGGCKGNIIQLTNDNHTYLHPSFTPNEEKIIYVSNESSDNYYQIFIMDINGSNHMQITFDKHDHYYPSIGPNNNILFIEDECIYLMDLNNSNKTFIANGSYPSYNYNYSQIVFTANKYFSNIYIYDILKENFTKVLIGGHYAEFYYYPKFDYSNTNIIFSFKPTMSGIITFPGVQYINIKNGNIHTIISTIVPPLYEDSGYFQPTFLPDNNNILYLHNGGIWLTDINRTYSNIVLNETIPIQYYNINAKGNKIVYVLDGDIWILDGGTIDTDRDKIIDYFDHDDDNDGYNDTIELAEGTDPLNKNSMPPDLDKDYIPDSIDPDIDGDGILNEDDDYPYTPMKLRKEDSDLIPILIVASIYSIILIIIIVIMLRKYSRNRKQF